MAHLGAWPVAEETPVGAYRAEIGDDEPVTAPAEDATQADFEFFSDVYIEAQLAKYADDPDEAMARGLDTMARRLIIEAEDIQVDDIKIKTVERAKLFSEHAAQIRAYGVTKGGEGFTITPLTVDHTSGFGYTPQGTPFSQVG